MQRFAIMGIYIGYLYFSLYLEPVQQQIYACSRYLLLKIQSILSFLFNSSIMFLSTPIKNTSLYMNMGHLCKGFIACSMI